MNKKKLNYDSFSFENRYRRIKKICLKKGIDVKVWKDYKKVYDEKGRWLKSPFLTAKPSGYAEIPDFLRVGVAYMIWDYLNKYLDPLFLEIIKDNKKDIKKAIKIKTIIKSNKKKYVKNIHTK